jgi:VanZ family protein
MAECGLPGLRRGFDPFRPLDGPVAECIRKGRGTVLHPGSTPGRASTPPLKLRRVPAVALGEGGPGLQLQSMMTTIKIARVTAWLLVLAAAFLTLAPRSFRPVTGVEHHLEHFLAFTILGLVFATGYPNRRLVLALAGIAMAGLLETFQSWAPGRHANFSDFAVNAIGLCVGVALVAVIDRMRRKIQDTKGPRREPAPQLVTGSADSASAAASPLRPPGAHK